MPSLPKEKEFVIVCVLHMPKFAPKLVPVAKKWCNSKKFFRKKVISAEKKNCKCSFRDLLLKIFSFLIYKLLHSLLLFFVVNFTEGNKFAFEALFYFKSHNFKFTKM